MAVVAAVRQDSRRAVAFAAKLRRCLKAPRIPNAYVWRASCWFNSDFHSHSKAIPKQTTTTQEAHTANEEQEVKGNGTSSEYENSYFTPCRKTSVRKATSFLMWQQICQMTYAHARPAPTARHEDTRIRTYASWSVHYKLRVATPAGNKWQRRRRLPTTVAVAETNSYCCRCS